MSLAYTVINVDTTLTYDSMLYLIDATSNNVTVTLPSVTSQQGSHMILKRVDSSVNTVTIDPSPNTIDGYSTLTMGAVQRIHIMVYNGNWFIV